MRKITIRLNEKDYLDFLLESNEYDHTAEEQINEIIKKAPGLSGDPSSTERGIGSRIVINAMKNGRQSDLGFAKTNRECLENAFPEIFDRIDSKFKDLI